MQKNFTEQGVRFHFASRPVFRSIPDAWEGDTASLLSGNILYQIKSLALTL